MSDDEEYEELIQIQRDSLAGFNALDQLKLHSNTKKAIEAMAHEGLPPTLAADRFGIRRDNFARTMKRPDVRQAYNRLVSTIRDNAAQSAYLRINELAKNAKSERVRLMANEWIAGVDGIAKVQRVDARVRHDVVFGGFHYPSLDAERDEPDQ